MERRALDDFAFVIGSWDAAMEFPRPDGSLGSASGSLVSTWGHGRAWIDCQLVATLPGDMQYAVRILVGPDGAAPKLKALAVNNMSPVAIVYGTSVVDSGFVQFVGSTGPRVQRVTYLALDATSIDFRVEESASEEGPWQFHSRALLRRTLPHQLA